MVRIKRRHAFVHYALKKTAPSDLRTSDMTSKLPQVCQRNTRYFSQRQGTTLLENFSEHAWDDVSTLKRLLETANSCLVDRELLLFVRSRAAIEALHVPVWLCALEFICWIFSVNNIRVSLVRWPVSSEISDLLLFFGCFLLRIKE